jgi:hypothetical protein
LSAIVGVIYKRRSVPGMLAQAVILTDSGHSGLAISVTGMIQNVISIFARICCPHLRMSVCMECSNCAVAIPRAESRFNGEENGSGSDCTTLILMADHSTKSQHIVDLAAETGVSTSSLNNHWHIFCDTASMYYLHT